MHPNEWKPEQTSWSNHWQVLCIGFILLLFSLIALLCTP